MVMNLKNAEYLLRFFSLAALIIAVIGRNAVISTILAFLCVFASLVILYSNLAKLSNLSEDNPKVRTLKSVTIFNAVFIGSIVLLAAAIAHFGKRGVLAELLAGMSGKQLNVVLKGFMALVLAVPVLFFGNAAPQIPFNRYTGLRLPWTVIDEETWIVAHRVTGYISIPIAILVFVNVPTNMLFEDYVKFWWFGLFLLWIAIPGFISGMFYYKKWTGKL